MSAALKTAELSGEALAFVKQGTPKPQVMAVPRAETPAVSSSDQTPITRMEEESQLEQQLPVRAKSTSKAVVQPETLVNLSFRVPLSLHNALKRASFEREMERVDPWTQQDIVAEALAAWFKKQA